MTVPSPNPVPAVPERPPPAAPDPRWESVYVTIEPDLFDTERVTIHLDVAGRPYQWNTVVPLQYHESQFPGVWSRVINGMVDGIDRALGWKPYVEEPVFSRESPVSAIFAARDAHERLFPTHTIAGR